MLRTLIRRMGILSAWAAFTAIGDGHQALSERYKANSRVERHLLVFDRLFIGRGWVLGREVFNLRPVRGAPQSAEGMPGISRYRSDFLRHDA